MSEKYRGFPDEQWFAFNISNEVTEDRCGCCEDDEDDELSVFGIEYSDIIEDESFIEEFANDYGIYSKNYKTEKEFLDAFNDAFLVFVDMLVNDDEFNRRYYALLDEESPETEEEASWREYYDREYHIDPEDFDDEYDYSEALGALEDLDDFYHRRKRS